MAVSGDVDSRLAAAAALPWHAARLTWSGRRAEIAAGQQGFFIESEAIGPDDHPRADFAALGLAVLSLSGGNAYRLEQPVSRGVAQMLQRLAQAFDLWQVSGLHPLRLWLPDIANDLPPRGKGQVICASGGVDSTSSAIEARAKGGATHGLLIAGADYPHHAHAAYGELKSRVAASCGELGLGLVEVKTSLREIPCNWEMVHCVALAMCLYFVSPRFASGGFALDNSLVQDMARHPWGNSAAMARVLGSGPFPITGYGEDRDRIDKVRMIAAQGPQVLDRIAVCWRDVSTAGNCGRCSKCIWTRLDFLCAGIDDRGAFPLAPPLESLIPSIDIPAPLVNLRGMHVRCTELLWHLPEGRIRSLVALHVARLRDAMRRLEPSTG